ncbi:sulfotransferase [Parerythrobacter lacustris]|uniref:Sulfotransferase n=1 Tax=Parerythrobacter lacustris TaxID=2969984 RepID=A0ABT1XNG7_9SPHN|nr:sulfotransferase [Parerythrobacter lacustris]MCR2833200.1 sulfotransferase [Parerythrobacter lacustris]
MSKHKIERVAAAVTTHLFILCPNNSGSTYLSRAIAQSRHVWSLEREGQHVLGFAGPQTLNSPWPLVWAADAQRLAHFRDSPDYDWDRTRKAWYFHATAARTEAPVLHTKAPPFLLIADQLRDAFANTRFIIMVRNPYATLEGILRRWQRTDASARTLNLAEAGARHIVACFEQQMRNIDHFGDCSIAFTYEDLCADPRGKAAAIRRLVPELDDLDLTQRLAIKGTYDEPLRNMNEEQIARLDPAEIERANTVFAHSKAALTSFGYALMV